MVKINSQPLGVKRSSVRRGDFGSIWLLSGTIEKKLMLVRMLIKGQQVVVG